MGLQIMDRLPSLVLYLLLPLVASIGMGHPQLSEAVPALSGQQLLLTVAKS